MPTPAVNLDTLTIEEFGRRLRTNELTAEAVTDACLQRIDAQNPRLNAFILVMADAARAQARRPTRRARRVGIAAPCRRPCP